MAIICENIKQKKFSLEKNLAAMKKKKNEEESARLIVLQNFHASMATMLNTKIEFH